MHTQLSKSLQMTTSSMALTVTFILKITKIKLCCRWWHSCFTNTPFLPFLGVHFYLFTLCHMVYISNYNAVHFILFTVLAPSSDQYLVMFEEQYSSSGILEVLIASRQDGIIDFDDPGNQNAIVGNQEPIRVGYNVFNFSTTLQGRNSEIKRKAMLINASVPISVFGMTQWYGSAEAYMALPVSALGNEYRVVSYEPTQDDSEFMVAAIHDNTKVNITFFKGHRAPSVSGMQCSYNGNEDMCTIVLNKLQTLHIQNRHDLTGTRIASNQSIGVLSGTKCTHVIASFGDCQPLVSYLLPIKHWGHKFIVPPLSPAPAHVVKIWSAEDNTVVMVTDKNNGTQRHIVNMDDGWNRTFRGNLPLYLSSDKPIMVTVISAEKSHVVEASMVAVPSISHYNSSYTIAFAKTGDYDNKLLLFGDRNIISNVMLNGSPISGGNITSVPPGNNVVLRVDVKTDYAFLDSNARNSTFGAIAYGISRAKYPLVYAYPAGMRFPTV